MNGYNPNRVGARSTLGVLDPDYTPPSASPTIAYWWTKPNMSGEMHEFNFGDAEPLYVIDVSGAFTLGTDGNPSLVLAPGDWHDMTFEYVEGGA